MLNEKELNMVEYIRDYFNTWQTIATKKEIHDQILYERKLDMTQMMDMFVALNHMLSSLQLTFQKGYYSKNWA